MGKNESVSYLCGSFLAMAQMVEELVLPTMETRGTNWGDDILLLFQTNPESTMQLVTELLKKFPEKLHENNNIYQLDDLIQIYKRIDMANIANVVVDKDDFIAGYRSKIYDFSEEWVETEAEVNPLLSKESEEINFRVGMLVAKIQFMQEHSDSPLPPKGEAFMDDMALLLGTNKESCVQILLGSITHMPDFCMVGSILLTSREIQDLFLLIGVDKITSMEVNEEFLKKGYRKQVDYFLNEL